MYNQIVNVFLILMHVGNQKVVLTTPINRLLFKTTTIKYLYNLLLILFVLRMPFKNIFGKQ